MFKKDLIVFMQKKRKCFYLAILIRILVAVYEGINESLGIHATTLRSR